jgi:integrase
MTPEQAKEFLDAAHGDRHEALMTFLLLTGVRPSEAFALKWADLDLDERTATVRRTLVRTKGTWRFAEPKTDAGRRVLQLPEEMVDILQHHRAVEAERRLKLADVWSDHDLVFPGEVGEPLDISAVRRRHFYKICIKAGLSVAEEGEDGTVTVRPVFNLYSLRHTFASMLARANAHPRVAAAMLGQADITTTLGVYTHSEEDLERTAAHQVAELLNKT